MAIDEFADPLAEVLGGSVIGIRGRSSKRRVFWECGRSVGEECEISG